MRRTSLVPALLLLSMTLGPGAPATEKKPMTDTQFGTAVRDAVSVSEGGSEAGGVRVYDVASGPLGAPAPPFSNVV